MVSTASAAAVSRRSDAVTPPAMRNPAAAPAAVTPSDEDQQARPQAVEHPVRLVEGAGDLDRAAWQTDRPHAVLGTVDRHVLDVRQPIRTDERGLRCVGFESTLEVARQDLAVGAEHLNVVDREWPAVWKPAELARPTELAIEQRDRVGQRMVDLVVQPVAGRAVADHADDDRRGRGDRTEGEGDPPAQAHDVPTRAV